VVAGSAVLAVPAALLDILHLQPGAKAGIAVEKGRVASGSASATLCRSCSPSAIPRLSPPKEARKHSRPGPGRGAGEDSAGHFERYSFAGACRGARREVRLSGTFTMETSAPARHFGRLPTPSN